jgi:transcriptional regulator with GAF, ATPase, and Fis domain
MLNTGLTSSFAFPLITRGKVLGVLHFSFKKCPEQMDELVQFFRELTDLVAVAVENMLAYNQLKEVNENLEQQKHYLLERVEEAYNPDAFFYESLAMRKVMEQVELIAPTDASVLITGETGTGKDFIARHIHRLSPRREGLFVKVNCPALTANLFESELFGHAKGAFTGAVDTRAGRWEMADGGVIFLDEIGELPIDRQAKLLHVLQDHYFERVGDSRPIKANARVVAATNCDLDKAVGQGDFRSDFYYRLNTFSLHLPPLRERIEEIPGLVHRLNWTEAQKAHRAAPNYSRAAINILCGHQWPGNVRELKNLVKRMIIMKAGQTIHGRDVQTFVEAGQSEPVLSSCSLAEAERRHIEMVLTRTKGRLAGKQGAATLLGIPRTTLQYRLKKHGIDHNNFRFQ